MDCETANRQDVRELAEMILQIIHIGSIDMNRFCYIINRNGLILHPDGYIEDLMEGACDDE